MDLITLALAKKYVNKKFAEAVSFGGFQIIDTLPVENISTTTVYLLKSKSATEGNVYEEYIYTNGKWESLGTTVDLEGYLTEDTLQAAIDEALRQAKENGDFKPVKGEDYWTDEDKQEIVDEVVAQMPEPEAGGMYYDKYDIDLPAQGVWNYLNFKNTRTLLDFSIGQVARSDNGRQWSIEQMQGETVPDNIIGIACSPDMIIAVAEKTNVIYMSTDGTNWSSKDLGSFRIADGENETDGYYGVITYLDNKFIIAITEYSGDSWEYRTLPNYNVIISSDNGNTWERAKLGDPEDDYPVQITRFYYWDNVLYFQSKENVLFSCFGIESKPELISSTLSGDFAGKIGDTYYDFVNGSLYSSTDGVEWKFFGPDCATSYLKNWSFAYDNDSIFLWIYAEYYSAYQLELSGLYVRHRSEPWQQLFNAKDISSSARFIYTGQEFLLTNPTGEGSLLYSGTGTIWDNDVAQSLVQDGRDITSDVKNVILKDFNRLEYRHSVNNFDEDNEHAMEPRTTGLVKGKTTLKDSNNIYVATRRWIDSWWRTGGQILWSFDGISWERALAPAVPWYDVVYLEEEELFIAISGSIYGESMGSGVPTTQLGFSTDGYNWECIFLPEEVQDGGRGGVHMATTRSSEIVLATSYGQIVLGSYDSSSHTCTWTLGPDLPDYEGCVKVTTAPNGYYIIGDNGNLFTYSAEKNEIINTLKMPAQFTDIIWYTEEMYFYRQIAITENNEIYRSYDQPDAPWYKQGEYDLHFMHFTDYTNYFQHTDSDSGEVYTELGTHNAVFCIEGIFDIQDNKLISFNTGDSGDQFKRFLNLGEGIYLIAPGRGPTIMSHDYGEHWLSEDIKAIKQGKDNVSQGVAEALWPYLDTPINSSIAQALSDLKVDDLLKRIEELEKQNSNVWGQF